MLRLNIQRERETKKRQKSHEMKEIRVAVKIDTHDLMTKVRRAGEFLDEGDRVKVTVRFRGREISHANLGRDLLIKTAELLAEHGTIERQPLLEGKSMYIVMAPLEKRADKPERPEKSERERRTADATAEPAVAGSGQTIGDVVAARGQQPTPAQGT